MGPVVAASAGIRTWLVGHTAVAARDSIDFIRYTWQLQKQPLAEVLRRKAHPPLYPLAIWALLASRYTRFSN